MKVWLNYDGRPGYKCCDSIQALLFGGCMYHLCPCKFVVNNDGSQANMFKPFTPLGNLWAIAAVSLTKSCMQVCNGG